MEWKLEKLKDYIWWMNNLEYVEAQKKQKKYHEDPKALNKYQGISKRDQIQTR